MDRIPKIFVINLPHRTDRLESIKTELDRVGLLDKMEIVEGVVIPVEGKLGTAGVAEAHARCLELAKQRGYEMIMVLEDDCKFLCSKDQLNTEFETFFNNPPSEWNGVWFGSFYGDSFPGYEENPSWIRTKYIVQDTATLFHSRSYDTFIELYRFCRDKYIETGDEQYNIDGWLNYGNIPVYALRNKLCGQANCLSDRTYIGMHGGCEMELTDFKN